MQTYWTAKSHNAIQVYVFSLRSFCIVIMGEFLNLSVRNQFHLKYNMFLKNNSILGSVANIKKEYYLKIYFYKYIKGKKIPKYLADIYRLKYSLLLVHDSKPNPNHRVQCTTRCSFDVDLPPSVKIHRNRHLGFVLTYQGYSTGPLRNNVLHVSINSKRRYWILQCVIGINNVRVKEF